MDDILYNMVNAGGDRNIPYLNSDSKRWYVNFNWISNDFNRNDRVARSC